LQHSYDHPHRRSVPTTRVALALIDFLCALSDHDHAPRLFCHGGEPQISICHAVTIARPTLRVYPPMELRPWGRCAPSDYAPGPDGNPRAFSWSTKRPRGPRDRTGLESAGPTAEAADLPARVRQAGPPAALRSRRDMSTSIDSIVESPAGL